MSRKDLKDIIARVIVRLENEAPSTSCIFSDHSCDTCDTCDTCDYTTRYAIGEEG